MAKTRRPGGLPHQRHDHPTCPPMDADGTRPPHRCRGRWAVNIELGHAGGKRVRKTLVAATKGAVEKKAKAAQASIAQGVVPDDATTGEWLTYWLDKVVPNSDRRPTTVAGYRGYVHRYLIPHLGAVPLQKLRVEHVEAMRDAMRTRPDDEGGPLSDTTIKQAHKILTAALDEALKRERVLRNVAKVAKPPKAPRNKYPSPDADQARAILAAARDSRELARLTVALVLGIRQGEALGLRWSDLEETDSGAVLLHVRRSVARVGGKLTEGGVKSAASDRVYLLPEPVAMVLAGWRAVAPPGEPYVFPGHHGGPEDARRDWQAWTDALERAGLPHFALHSARGATASILVNESDAPDWLASKLLGHAGVDVTRRHYIDATMRRGSEALDALAARLGLA